MGTHTGIKTIVLTMDAGGNPFVVHTALLQDENGAVLVDTGIPGQLELIRSVLEKESVAFDQLKQVIITHQDRDHIGSLPEIVEASGGDVQVLAHELAVPYLSGEVPLIKSNKMAPPVRVDVLLQDGDVLPISGGLQVIFTPGHTPEHISLFHIPTKTLISGDALSAQDGVLMPFSPVHTLDHKLAAESIAKLLDFDIETVIAYHGGVVTGGIRERLREILEEVAG